MTEIHCDILIVGGSAGGTAAALAAAEAGASVCLLEKTGWPGGQLTTQGVCTPDEQPYIETFGGTRRYQAFRQAIRDHYRTQYRLAPEAAVNPRLNPGNCWVSALSFEPKTGVAVLREMLRPWEESGHLKIFYQTEALAYEHDPHSTVTLRAILARQNAAATLRFVPRYVLDATDTGELLALCGEEGVDWVVGAESRAQTGEPDAPETPRPEWVQPFTFPFALDWSPETADTNLIAPPEDYEALKTVQNYQVRYGAITGMFDGHYAWWRYRRVLAAENFDDPRVPADLAMINTPGNDFYGGNILGADAGSPEKQADTLARARRAALGFVHWLQTECPREETRTPGPTVRTDHSAPAPLKGYPEFRLRKDVFETPDGCSLEPYIRESRRILSLRPILEQEIVVRDFAGTVCRGDKARAVFMPDSVGIGHYALDIHPNGHGEPNHYVSTRPFQIPLGALIPVRFANLLPACKNLGTTHLSNGAYRLHPIEWNIGESAALLAVFCLRHHCQPREVYDSPERRQALQRTLLENGMALHWYVDVPLDHPAFLAVQTLAGFGLTLGSEADLLFHPDAPITAETWQQWRDTFASGAPETFAGTRAEAAQRLLLSGNDAFKREQSCKTAL